MNKLEIWSKIPEIGSRYVGLTLTIFLISCNLLIILITNNEKKIKQARIMFQKSDLNGNLSRKKFKTFIMEN